MKGLLRKDFYMLWKCCRINFVIILLYGLIAASGQSSFMSYFPCVMAALIPVTLLGYDERSRWDEYAAVLPCTARELVGAKYLLGLALQLGTAFYVMLVTAATSSMRGGLSWAELGKFILTLLMISGVSSSLCLPFIFRYGVEKGRVAYYVVMVASFGASAVAVSLKEQGIWQTNGEGVWVLLPALAAVLITAASWRLSIRLYQKRRGA